MFSLFYKSTFCWYCECTQIKWRRIFKFPLLFCLIPALTIVTVKKVFIHKALKTLLTLVTSCKYGKNKGSQLNMCSFTWLVQIVTWPEQFTSCLHLEKIKAASKLWNKRLVKYFNIKIWQSFLVHIIFKVSSINIWIHIECGHRMSKHVDGHNSDRWDNSELRFTI